MTHSYQSELETALLAVREAAELCQEVQREIGGDVLEKKDRSPVTVADFGSQAVICRRLRQAFPEDPVIGEESSGALKKPENAELSGKVVEKVRARVPDADLGSICVWIDHGRSREGSARFWTLDPIDGTKGFLRKEQYAISLALIVDGQIRLGILGCPNLSTDVNAGVEPDDAQGSLFFAVAGHGAFATTLIDPGDPRPVRISDTAASSEARFCESVESGHSSHDDAARIAARLGITAAPVRLDSQAKYAVVARGSADLYLRMPTRADYLEKIWDHAAGVLLVQEAGGSVSDIHGKPLDFSRGAELSGNQGVLASNGVLHAQAVEAIRAVREAGS